MRQVHRERRTVDATCGRVLRAGLVPDTNHRARRWPRSRPSLRSSQRAKTAASVDLPVPERPLTETMYGRRSNGEVATPRARAASARSAHSKCERPIQRIEQESRAAASVSPGAASRTEAGFVVWGKELSRSRFDGHLAPSSAEKAPCQREQPCPRGSTNGGGARSPCPRGEARRRVLISTLHIRTTVPARLDGWRRCSLTDPRGEARQQGADKHPAHREQPCPRGSTDSGGAKTLAKRGFFAPISLTDPRGEAHSIP